MLILGIETSCDETGVAIYDSEKGLLGHKLYSQIKLHAKYGGVVPELASRDHINYIIPLIHDLLSDCKINIQNIEAIAYTSGPGLSGALLVGSSVAESLACALGIRSIPIHHLEGHLLAPMLEDRKPKFPFIALLVSGGHSQLIHVKELGSYKIIGDTLDDAAGEAFDKTAQLLGLGYPGGAALSKLAEKGLNHFELPRPLLHSNGLDFSFSGLKTAVLYLVRKQKKLTKEIKADIAYAFEDSITDVLVKKTIQALKQEGLKRVIISGGVGANKTLRNKIIAECNQNEFEYFFPDLTFCTDNGAMIALAGSLRLNMRPKENYSFSVKPRWKLTEI
ncbi:tRNA (adenosine(37)-N6)-threonylcarbamoyltransferase complex transferase subunit TsaD [Methylophilaceae bacterium]|jgi:N6-L-threonylcarbamoyladenine synthase|nr:tRNA (adenosine(37)-N6)-threonylcarbamoyltransferase complex transferase subunit TsaD [Methylophilaceae bacterium]